MFEERYLLGYNAMYLKVNRRFGGSYLLNLQGRIISRTTNHRESRWQVRSRRWKQYDLQLTTRRYIPGDSTLHSHRCENLKSYNPVPGGITGPLCSWGI
jgi:hypothetical protein